MITSIHLSYVLGTLPLEERFPAARSLGFDAVEYPFPYEVPANAYRRLLDDNGLTQISIGAPACDYRNGEPGFSLTPASRDAFDRSIDTVIAYATTIGCPNVHIFAGSRAPGISSETAFETYCTNLAEAHERLRREGLRIVIEAVNAVDFPGYFMDRLDRVSEAIERIGRDDIGVILDLYHAGVNGEDPAAFLRNDVGRIAHVQLADFPGRHEPGTGSVDFAAFFRTMRDSGYRGSIGMEYVPTRSVFDGVPLADVLFADREPPASSEPRRTL